MPVPCSSPDKTGMDDAPAVPDNRADSGTCSVAESRNAQRAYTRGVPMPWYDILMVYEEVDDVTVYPVTAYEVDG